MFKELRVQASTPDFWDNTFLKERSFYFGGVMNALFAANRVIFDPRWHEIAKRVPKGARLLDAGCGLGKWVQFMRRQGIDAIGLDYSEQMVSALKAQYPDTEFIAASIQDIPVPENSLDAIISWGVIEHDEDGPKAALRSFLDKLKPGGHLFVTVPYDSATTRNHSEVLKAGNKDGETFYQYFFTEQDLKEVLEENGFVIDTIFPTDRHYAVIFPQANHRLRRFGHLGEALIALFLKPYLNLRQDSFLMVFAAATKPN